MERSEINRRKFIGYFSAIGLSSTLLPGALAAVSQENETITADMLKSAEKIAGIEFHDEERKEILRSLNGRRSVLRSYESIRERNIDNSVAPAIVFNPLPADFELPADKKPCNFSRINIRKPNRIEDLAFSSVLELGNLIRNREITSTDLTKMYLARLKKYNPTLNFFVTITEDLALRQAKKADDEIRAGNYRGPLHGIPWGAKDLFAVKGYKTTWGAAPYKDQVIDTDATIVKKLEEAGAVLVAKLTLGALAMGDNWFGGRTKNPWDPEQGSSGSSAGPGSATAAGCVGFAIGTETRGSIVSPSTRCGVTGLRPTPCRVSRHGAMALSWTMDKVGPMCRYVEDCAVVFDSIIGPDGKDRSLFDVPFNWDTNTDIKKLRIGYLKKAFEREIPDNPEREEQVKRSRENLRLSNDVLDVMRGLGVELIPIDIDIPTSDISFILSTEAAAAFDELTRSGRDELLKANSWARTFRNHRLIPAVEYIQANRARTLVIEKMHETMKDIDVYIEPTHTSTGLTNLTGHPAVVLPNGFIEGRPVSVTFIGKLFGEAETLAVAKAYQDASGFHLKHPELK
ncbi:MAG: amidase [bacterium]|nr:amidase [bacterium]